MCDPATFTFLGFSKATAATAASLAVVAGTVASVGGLMLKTAGAYTEEQALIDQTNYQAMIQRRNQKLAEKKASDELDIGRQEALTQKKVGKHFASRQMAQMAAQGGDITEGSNVDILADTAEASKLEEMWILKNAEQRSDSLLNSASISGNQAELYKRKAKSRSPIFKAATTGLVGAGNLFNSKFYST